MLNNQRSPHRKALEKIAKAPQNFGIEHIVSCAIEQTLYHNGRGIIAQPDIIFESSDNQIYIIEYKGNGEDRLLERAQKQLENAFWWFGKYLSDILPNSIHTLILCGSDPKYKEFLK